MNLFITAVDAENQVELEEKTRLINQVLELQHTLEGELAFCSSLDCNIQVIETVSICVTVIVTIF